MSKCPNCGSSQNRPNAKFCSDCGMAISPGTPTPGTGLRPGQVMNGLYTIVRELGKGGMGAVYLAQQTIANRQRNVVIKEMLDYYDPNDPQGEAKARKRFETEAATLVTLNFAGILQIFDYFSQDGHNYIVMQYIPGQSLEKGLTHVDSTGNPIPGQPCPAEKVQGWGIQLCKVLENLESQGILHMDIKPANLILDDAGDVWLVDFGTAKAQRVLKPGGSVGLQKSSVYGTAGYAPPEQYQGNAEPRSDVYALAATIYHLLTNDDPRDHPFNFPLLSNLPVNIRPVLEQALEKDVGKRVTASEMREAFEQSLAPKSLSPPFVFASGDEAQIPQGLIRLCDNYWDEARGYLYNGDFEQWFRSMNRNDLITKAQIAVKQYEDKDEGLEVFLEALDPSLFKPKWEATPQALDFGVMPADGQQALPLKLRNRGRGYVRIEAQTYEPWLSVSPRVIHLRAGEQSEVSVEADLSATSLGKAAQGVLKLAGSNKRQQQVAVQARTSVLRTIGRRTWNVADVLFGGILFMTVWFFIFFRWGDQRDIGLTGFCGYMFFIGSALAWLLEKARQSRVGVLVLITVILFIPWFYLSYGAVEMNTALTNTAIHLVSMGAIWGAIWLIRDARNRSSS